MKKTVFDCSLIELPQNQDRSGNIIPIENNIQIPFEANRIFYFYDPTPGAIRGAHAHRECHQFLIAVTGSFAVQLDDGKVKKTTILNQPYIGLHIPPGIWATEVNFSTGAVCLVIASHKYDEGDYIRDYNSFLEFTKL